MSGKVSALLMLCGLLLAAPLFGQTQPLGATINRSGSTITGVTFRVWAPNATSVAVRGDFNGWGETAMTKDAATGYWSLTAGAARPGQEYKYFVRWSGNPGGTWKHDPRAAWVRGGNSVIYDHDAFDWGTTARPSIPVDRQVMYEMHIGSFHDPDPNDGRPGTFDDAIARLDYLERLGINVIALMPVNEFGGDYSWGYNPEHIFAVESAYGGPDGLKRFVKAAHARGIKVQLDVVHNHWNPWDDGLKQFDGEANIYFYPDNPQGWTAWGPRPDYSQPEVRRFIRENIKTYLDDFRIDGFRWDSPQNFLGYDADATAVTNGNTITYNVGNPRTVLPDGKSLMTEINLMIHGQYPGRWSIAEDADLLTVRPAGGWYPAGGFLELLRVDTADESFDGHWQTSFHNEITPQIASPDPVVQAILGKVNGWSEPPGYRVIFTDNHDKSGDMNGNMRLANRMVPADPAGKMARKKTLLNATLTLTAPGTPMLWMGQEFHATGAFSSGDTNRNARLDWREASRQHRAFRAHRDLVLLRENLPALQNSDLSTANGGLDDALDLLVYWRRTGASSADDVVVLMNFSGQARTNIGVAFPASADTNASVWHVRMNTDWPVYGSDFDNIGPAGTLTATNTNGHARASLNIAPHSAIIFARRPAPADVAVDDADANGLPDGWELLTGLSDPSADDDADGLSNLFEYQSGLDPLEKDVATVTYNGTTHVLRASSNNPVVQHIAWAVDPVSVVRPSSFTFLSNSIPGPFFTNPAGTYLRFSLDLTDSAASYSVFSPGTNLAVVDTNRTNWAVFHGVADFNANPDNDAFTNLQEFARGSDPNAANRALICLAGQFNGWNASANPMRFAGDNVWVLDLPFRGGITSLFKFTSTVGTNTTWWGDIQPDGVADDNASDKQNISLNSNQGSGIYRFLFNEETFAYRITHDSTDADGDGIQDAWIAHHGLTGGNASAAADPDGDGWSNLAEFKRFTGRTGLPMNPAVSDSATTPKRMTVSGSTNGGSLVPPWDPSLNNMTWSDLRNQWEWSGTASKSGTIDFKFFQGPGFADDDWGVDTGGAPGWAALKGPNIAINVTNNVRYRITFDDVALTYSITSHPFSTEWWETNGLPAPLPATGTDPRWDEDPDGDGFTHRVEYALGGNPLAADGGGLSSSWQTNGGGTNRLVLQWLQRTNDPAGLSVVPVLSTNLFSTNWTAIAASNSALTNGVPANHRRREASVPMDGAAKFLRLRVIGP